MTSRQWVTVVLASIPVAVGAGVVAATLGPIGALLYLALVLAGVNTRHLFRDDRIDLLNRLRKALHR